MRGQQERIVFRDWPASLKLAHHPVPGREHEAQHLAIIKALYSEVRLERVGETHFHGEGRGLRGKTQSRDARRGLAQIAAANALSDVYAMGGRPVSALSLVGFPEKGDPAILEEIIRGGLAKMNEAKCSVIGGHSIRN